jgi:hypothetical protein
MQEEKGFFFGADAARAPQAPHTNSMNCGSRHDDAVCVEFFDLALELQIW